ncbi:hypothetical protein [Empedobacter falsenii]
MIKYRHIIKRDQFALVKLLLEESCSKIFKEYLEEFNREKELSLDLKAFYNQKILTLGLDVLSFDILKSFKFKINDDFSVSFLNFKNAIDCLNELKYERKLRYKARTSNELIDYFFENIYNSEQDRKDRRGTSGDFEIIYIEVNFDNSSAYQIGKKKSYNDLFIKSYIDAITDMIKIVAYKFILSVINEENIQINFKENKHINSQFNAKQWGILVY